MKTVIFVLQPTHRIVHATHNQIQFNMKTMAAAQTHWIEAKQRLKFIYELASQARALVAYFSPLMWRRCYVSTLMRRDDAFEKLTNGKLKNVAIRCSKHSIPIRQSTLARCGYKQSETKTYNTLVRDMYAVSGHRCRRRRQWRWRRRQRWPNERVSACALCALTQKSILKMNWH